MTAPLNLGQLPDESDRATELEMAMTESAIAHARIKARRKQEPDANGVYAITECEECGDEIEPARLAVAAMNTWCIHCATMKERKR